MRLRARRCRWRWTSLPEEDAVVLLEHDGCYTWLRPRHESSRDPQLVGRVAVFEFVVPPAGAGSRDLAGLPAGAARATVLSYASPLLATAAIRALELVVEPGLVHLAGVDPADWRHVGSLADTGLSRDRNSRVLLFVHGTFDSTLGAFGGLAATEAGRTFLTQALADYDAVVGFDHRTLSVDPLENARDLADLLTPFRGRQVTLDIIGHSRGGLTARSFVESVLPGLSWRGKVDRAVFVGRHERRDPLRRRDPLGGPRRPVHQPRRRQRARDRGAPRRCTHRGARRRSGARYRCPGALARLLRDRPGQRARYRRDGPRRARSSPTSTRTSGVSRARARRGSSSRPTSRSPSTTIHRRCRSPSSRVSSTAWSTTSSPARTISSSTSTR